MFFSGWCYMKSYTNDFFWKSSMIWWFKESLKPNQWSEKPRSKYQKLLIAPKVVLIRWQWKDFWHHSSWQSHSYHFFVAVSHIFPMNQQASGYILYTLTVLMRLSVLTLFLLSETRSLTFSLKKPRGFSGFFSCSCW